MPEFRDFAALPTSWALTMWDSLPVYLSVEVAIALAIVVLTGVQLRGRLWSLSSTHWLAAVVYLLLFDPRLAAILAAGAMVQFAAIQAGRLKSPEPATPGSPLEALRSRGGSVAWGVATASAFAAAVKIIVPPVIASDSPSWFIVAVIGGLFGPGPIGLAAIPALATQTAANSLVAGALWIASAAVRPVMIDRYRAWREGDGSRATVAGSESQPPAP